MYSYENTYNEQTGEWHPHVHMLVLLNDWIDQEQLSETWHEITGDSFVVDVRRVKKSKEFGYAKAAAEVCKYALKFGDLTVEKTWEAFKILKGKRLSGAFGSLYGVKIPENLADEMPDDQDLPYLEMLYKFVFGKHSYYDLLITRHVEPHSKDNDDEEELRQRGEGGRSDLAITDKRGRCRCEGPQSRNDHSEDVKKPTGESHLLPVFVFGNESEDGTDIYIILTYSRMLSIGY